ncbi:LemA family protein [Sphingomonas sp. SUN039]|uniref:LemA family protein n=1 Tax=Sphingomonas sp. SUN039 TaxID=2937787 RepID=UPI0021649992|nr:LemA family protein [Sphingomonas sp. SUN039]UVO55485.1 LemA family protein [Sphingomonas sp. SUN039]
MTPIRRLALLAPLAAVSLSGCGINSIPTAEEAAKAKWANVQADYQRRADLIPNLVATVKGFAKQEKDVLTTVTQARASANSVTLSPGDLTDPAKVAAFQNAQNNLTFATRQLQEAYPELKSNANFMALQSQLEGTENRVNISIKDYNEAVQKYNTTIRTFPDAIGAKIFYGSKPMVTYTATAPNAENAPKVDFN